MSTKELPLLTLNRDYVLTTLKGHSIQFLKNKPTRVPPAVYQDALAIGAQPADGTDLDVLGEDAKVEEPMDPDQRNPLILAAIEKLMERNTREDFTAAGAPTVRAVDEEVGFKVHSKEIAAMWQKIHDDKAAQ